MLLCFKVQEGGILKTSWCTLLVVIARVKVNMHKYLLDCSVCRDGNVSSKLLITWPRKNQNESIKSLLFTCKITFVTTYHVFFTRANLQLFNTDNNNGFHHILTKPITRWHHSVETSVPRYPMLKVQHSPLLHSLKIKLSIPMFRV
jgi:hypothetical protein